MDLVRVLLLLEMAVIVIVIAIVIAIVIVIVIVIAIAIVIAIVIVVIFYRLQYYLSHPITQSFPNTFLNHHLLIPLLTITHSGNFHQSSFLPHPNITIGKLVIHHHCVIIGQQHRVVLT